MTIIFFGSNNNFVVPKKKKIMKNLRSTFRVLFLLRESRIKKDGLSSLMIRITINKDKFEISSQLSIDSKTWDAKAGKVSGRSNYAFETNANIEFIRSRLHKLYIEIQQSDGYVTVDRLRNRYLGIEEQQYTLLKLFDKKITQKEALVGKGISKETLEKYISTKSKLVGFIKKYYQQKDILIKDVQYDFITNYDIYLRSTCNCQHNTVVRHMRYLKQVITDAIKCNYLQVDPFIDFTLSSKRGDRKYLTEHELKQIMEKDFASEKLKEVRDIFIFCCFSGLAYVDVSRLRKEDIVTNSKGDQFIIKNRAKTGVESYVPLLDVPLMILERYKDKDFPNDQILPICACQNMNIYIKEIAALCGINKALSTHCGRHTYATLMLTKGVSVESVSKMLGHTDIKTTQIYAKILHQKVDDEMNMVRDDLNQMKYLFQ